MARAQSVWVAPSTQKIRPTAPTGTATSASLEAARNEFEAFHVVIAGAATGVAVTASPLTGPSGAAIGGGDVRVFREAFLDVSTKSNVAGDTGRWPDALIPAVDELFDQPRNAFPVDVPAGEQQPVLVEYHVPAAAPAGVYRGTVHVSAGAFAADVPVTLTVHGFQLPSTSSLTSAYGMGWSDACVAHFGSYAACGGDAGVEKMLALYTRFALDHRVTISESVYAGPAASGGGYDWATWDQKYGPFLDGSAPTRLAGAKLTSLRYAWTADSAHYGAWAAHFRDRGWFDRTFDYTCDEPPLGCQWSDITSRADMVHAGDPDFHTLTTTTMAEASSSGVLGALDTLVPNLNLLQPMSAPSTRATYDAWLSGGAQRRLWWYQSCMSDGCFVVGGPETVGWPSYMVDAPATLNRAMEWQSWSQKMQGELYYDTTYAFTHGDAWSNQYYFGGNGDGTLFYPGTPARIGGTTDIPIASLRLKMIREGMEDYEYLKLLADSGDRAMADDEAAKISPSPTSFTTDPAAIDGARHRIAARIDQLLGLPAPGDPAASGNSNGTANSGANGNSNGTANPGANGNSNGGANGAANGTNGGAANDSGAPPARAGGCSAPGGRTPRPAVALLPAVLLALAIGLLRARSRR
ncbi:MAG TPA: glycoside hydrolase domain-containing protein [Polyangia bacterium]|nr:glycoside hydrolase domain-containing protein [Polyangia bacterium]